MPNETHGQADRGKPAVTIIVNTRPHEWFERDISFEDVYKLAYPDVPLQPDHEVRVEYSRGANGNGTGALHPGTSVKVKKGMVFDVYVTVRS